jgi:peptidyl-prolyl cis-trans isomerase SurA
MIRHTAGLLAAVILMLVSGIAVPDQRIAAVVNDEVVSELDLSDRLRLVLLTSSIPDSEAARAQLTPQVLRGLIEETLQRQEAARLGIEVTDQEIENALQNIAERNQMSVDQMRSFLVSNGINLDTLQLQIRSQIAWVKVVNLVIRPQVNVTVDQLELVVQEARRNQGQPEYLLSEIVLPVDNPGQQAKVADDAQRLVQTLRAGASFPDLARQVSASASAEQGGDVGWIGGYAIPPELLNALEQLGPGDISDPIPSPVGYHIFWLRERRLSQGPVAAADAEVEVDLVQILFPADANADDATLTALRSEAAALRDRLVDCDAMAEVAAELDAPASGRLGWVRVGDLPPTIGQAVLSLEPGRASAPLRGPAGIHVLMVCERRGGATIEEEEIATRLEQERLDRLARRHLRDLRKQAFVEVRI